MLPISGVSQDAVAAIACALAGSEKLHLARERQAPSDIFREAVTATLQAIAKLKGTVELCQPSTLPHDRKATADELAVYAPTGALTQSTHPTGVLPDMVHSRREQRKVELSRLCGFRQPCYERPQILTIYPPAAAPVHERD